MTQSNEDQNYGNAIELLRYRKLFILQAMRALPVQKQELLRHI